MRFVHDSNTNLIRTKFSIPICLQLKDIPTYISKNYVGVQSIVMNLMGCFYFGLYF